MIETLQRFGDVVIADVAQGRNMYQMPLNVFCVVDGAGRTRNVAYVVQDRQDHDAHQWALQQLVSASGSKPSVIMSDQDAAFMSAVRKVCPDANYLLCLWHLWKNSPRDSDTDREEGSPFDEAGVDDDVDMNIQEDEDIARELPNDEQNTGLDAEYLADMIGSSGLKLHRWYIDPTSAAKSTPIQLRAPALAVDPPEKAVPVQLPGNTDIENAPTPGPGVKMPKVHAYHRATAATNNIMKALSTETRVKKFETMLENFLTETEREDAGFPRSTALRSPVLAPTPQPPRHAASASTATASNSVLAPPPAAETLASFEGPLLAEDVAAGVYGGYTIQRTLGIGAFSRVVFAVRPDSTLSPDLHAQLLTTPPPSPAPAAPT
ncbi:unnamed protein product [Tilletia controversa]|nr:unnamed protein product [Tilletia controversa]